jgi:pimeloyl-ACP methyl ester carboxylesterase
VRAFKYLLLGSAGLLISAVIIALISAQNALDGDFQHSRQATELAPLTDTADDGLVKVAMGDYHYRARISGFNDTDKPLVILLHGFPVTSAMWIDLIDPLALSGFRVIALDQRGYSPGARPLDLKEYFSMRMVEDVFLLADLLGAEKFHLVGHDWGSAIGWYSVMFQPARIMSYSGLSVPHPFAFFEAVENDPDQAAKSWYFNLFALPVIAETVLTMNNFNALKSMYSVMDRQKVDDFISAFSEPDALTAALNWYRAASMPENVQELSQLNPDISVPALFIWGNQDEAIGREATETMAKYMKGPYQKVEIEAGHRLIAEAPLEVVPRIMEHINGYNQTLTAEENSNLPTDLN